MLALSERSFVWSVLLAGVAFVLVTIGLEFAFLEWLPTLLLAAAAAILLAMMAQTGLPVIGSNRLRAHVFGWVIAAILALVVYSFAQKGMQDAVPWLKSTRKVWNVFEPFALFGASLFGLFAVALAIVGTKYSALDRPGQVERTLVTNLPAKIAAVPMAATAIGVFVIATLWTIYHSFTKSRLLPKSEFIGLDQYKRL